MSISALPYDSALQYITWMDFHIYDYRDRFLGRSNPILLERREQKLREDIEREEKNIRLYEQEVKEHGEDFIAKMDSLQKGPFPVSRRADYEFSKTFLAYNQEELALDFSSDIEKTWKRCANVLLREKDPFTDWLDSNPYYEASIKTFRKKDKTLRPAIQHEPWPEIPYHFQYLIAEEICLWKRINEMGVHAYMNPDEKELEEFKKAAIKLQKLFHAAHEKYPSMPVARWDTGLSRLIDGSFFFKQGRFRWASDSPIKIKKNHPKAPRELLIAHLCKDYKQKISKHGVLHADVLVNIVVMITDDEDVSERKIYEIAKRLS